MNQYICKASKLLGMQKNVSKWKFLALHDFGLKNQTDDVSCGLYCCIYAFSLLMLVDVAIFEDDFPLVRYWIQLYALRWSTLGDSKRCRATNVWEETTSTERKPSVLLELPGDGHGPFHRLRRYLENVPSKGKGGSFFQKQRIDDSSESDSNSDFSFTGDDTDQQLAKEFAAFSNKNAGELTKLNRWRVYQTKSLTSLPN